MTPEESVQAMAERLRAVDYARRGDKAWSKAALLREYFRRAARWADAYGCETRTPFFDIAQCVDPGVRAEQAVIDGLVRDVDDGTRNAIRQVAPFMLHWAALRAAPGGVMPEGLEDPFEPLILLFERGGGFHTENGEVNLEYLAAPLRGWRERASAPPMASFAGEALDEIDRAGSVAQFGHVIGPDGV
ncbi:hypothetical protein [Paractinoplanes atraurantiacus]|uniref:Uncharacterized protein n=1 Tax=Paractinoplanes atraurantiacus TaxID=1036182 RepID=A0A285KDA0_9ACTN|nr:hypothetical protein [Actinoplanes atraurantiacus]SNY69396.1 hypothetical protein SAMN05421748_13538 [Actinoplanes atraurantiacus]